MKTQTLLPLRVALLGASALLTHATFAQTWHTVDDYQFAAGKRAVARALAINPSGNLFVAGWATPAGSPAMEAQIHCSADGSTWALCDDFPIPSRATIYHGIASDLAGNLYAACQISADLLGTVVRRSQDNGGTWLTVDTSAGVPQGIATDSAGNIYVAGNNGTNWSVRKGTSGGASWSTVDSFNPGGVGSQAYAVFCHPTAGVFVTGYANTGSRGASVATVRRSLDGGATWTTVDHSVAGIGNAIGADAAGNIYLATDNWTVRKSSNGGTTWSTVDSFQYCVTTSINHKIKTQCYAATATGFARDAYGNLFIVGYSATMPAIWVVRESLGGTGAWQTVDTFQYAPGQYSVAFAVAADSFGSVYVAGHGDDISGVPHWIVRKY